MDLMYLYMYLKSTFSYFHVMFYYSRIINIVILGLLYSVPHSLPSVGIGQYCIVNQNNNEMCYFLNMSDFAREVILH